MTKRYENKAVLITGGGKGIGFGVAKAFAKEGANITITGRTIATLEKAKEELELLGIKVLILVADGGDEIQVKTVIKKHMETFGRLDALINNASSSVSGVPLVNQSKEDFDVAMHSGIYATFFFMKESYPLLKETKGSVVNFASGAGFSGAFGQASYAASKEGIRGISRVAAKEWGPDEVRVNVVAPLAMTEQLKHWKEEYPEVYEKTIKDIPLERFADPETDIGRVCVFLCSKDAGFITGETISVQGGAGMRP